MSIAAQSLVVAICLPSPHAPLPQRGPLINVARVDTTPSEPELPSPLVDTGIDWATLDLIPRWIGDDTSQAVAVLEPSSFGNTGGREVGRFLAGCGQRGEMAIAVSSVGGEGTAVMRALQLGGGTSALTDSNTTISAGLAVVLDTLPELARGLTGADRDLALRLRNALGAAARWWPIRLTGSTIYAAMAGPPGWQPTDPAGTLSPLLVSAAGEIVAAVWTPDDGTRARHYVVPSGAVWPTVLEWLPAAVAEFVPTASARARTATAERPEFHTARETAARAALEEAEQAWARRQGQLANELAAAHAEADAVRDPLLHGNGKVLESAVARVLRDAGLDVTDIDDLLGSPDCADLLVSDGSTRVLVEIKSPSGRPGERLVDDLLRHMRTWPLLRADLPAASGALVLNHQRNTAPHEREAEPYTRPEFVASLPVPVLTTRQLLDAWGQGDWLSIRAKLFSDLSTSAATRTAAVVPATTTPPRARLPHLPWRRGSR